MLSEGIIDKTDDIISLSLDDGDGRAEVITKKQEACGSPITLTVSGGRLKSAAYGTLVPKSEAGASKFTAKEILSLAGKFSGLSGLFSLTGGAHSAAICDTREILYFAEDIGRHNAIDKVLGGALIDCADISDKMLLTSGRVSSEIIRKLIRAGIPAAVSRSAPTGTAVELAREHGLMLAGFARGDSINFYSWSTL